MRFILYGKQRPNLTFAIRKRCEPLPEPNIPSEPQVFDCIGCKVEKNNIIRLFLRKIHQNLLISIGGTQKTENTLPYSPCGYGRYLPVPEHGSRHAAKILAAPVQQAAKSFRRRWAFRTGFPTALRVFPSPGVTETAVSLKNSSGVFPLFIRSPVRRDNTSPNPDGGLRPAPFCSAASGRPAPTRASASASGY